MKSAAAYINAKRVTTIAQNNKVEYPGKVAKNIESLSPTCVITPNFQVLNYEDTILKCKKCTKKQ